MKAYTFIIWDTPSVIAANTRPKASFHIFNSAKEAGYKLPFSVIRLRRAPAYDRSAKSKAEYTVWTKNLVEREMKTR